MTADPFIFIAGPCVIENESMTMDIARSLKSATSRFPLRFIFKASFDKANRTSVGSFRGPGIVEGLRILARVKDELGVEVISDVHNVEQIAPAAQVLDVLQIPAFLCRQTDLVVEAARTMKPLAIKKGQFVAPLDMRYAVEKAASVGNTNIILVERGTCFGYNDLVVDFRSFSRLAALGCPVVFDATHSVQKPSKGGVTSGDREFVAPLCRAAAAFGVDGIFIEAHPEPEQALSDGANSLHLADVEGLLDSVFRIREALSDSR